MIWNGVANCAWDANDTGVRGIRFRSGTATFYFPGASVEVPTTGVANQHVQCCMQLATAGDPGNAFVEVYQSSGGVLLSKFDGIQAPVLMLDYATGA